MALSEQLTYSGYHRVALVREPHEYALRGGVLDIFLPEHSQPLRLDFFDDEIEQLRYFDPHTQLGARSTIDAIDLLPAHEYPQSQEARDLFGKTWQKNFGGATRGAFYRSVMEHGRGLGAEYYLPLFFESTETIFDYMPDDALLVADARHVEMRQQFWHVLEKRIKERPPRDDYPMLPSDMLFISDKEWTHGCAALKNMEYVLAQEEISSAPLSQEVSSVPAPVSQNSTTGIALELSDLHDGDLIVHEDYGLGRYRGLQNLEIEGVAQDFIFLEYADKDELYLPIHALSLIYRHHGGGGEQEPRLHSLRGKRWERQRQKAFQKIEDTAAELIETQARRKLSETEMQADIPDEYAQFANSFPFPVTPDQQKAIDDVLNDLCAPASMDRLVCGDVGFGKTEVAARACFVSAFNGWQTIILVPTTLLAQQHVRHFTERFADFPIRIASISSATQGAPLRRCLNDLKNGNIDILIGTHRLLSGDLQFASLGLLIIDEEHRFGVTQKDHLARLRTSANMLGMTATPIPRTLHMSLNALKDLSIIGTPPQNRLPVQTCVTPQNDALIREAIQRELGRGGQVYYLHNNTETINRRARSLKRLIPDATISIAHGGMSAKILNDAMSGFYSGKTTLLLCTTIVESGLDVPNANTIIVERADLLGLAQLHQLRGRIGRSARQAYAWLLTPGTERNLKLDARRRLAAIAASNELGAGFVLATQDMEIRGVGSVLGKNQSGVAEDLGVAYYVRTLGRVVKNMRQGDHDAQVDLSTHRRSDLRLGISALLPEEWIADISVRLNLYRRISDAETQSALNDLQLELKDRFGRLPLPALNLFRYSALRLRADQLSIEKINVKSTGAYFILQEGLDIGPDMLAVLVDNENLHASIEVSGSSRLNLKCELTSAEERLELVESVVNALSQLDANRLRSNIQQPV
jgi:transcription-repair coupling factor (superfamily II helicase)